MCVRVLYSMGSRGLKQWVVTSKSHMGEMRVSDWSRPKILRSDWLGPIGAIMTTNRSVIRGVAIPVRTVRTCVPEKVVHKKHIKWINDKKWKVNSKKKAKYLKIIILRAQFASIHSTLVVSLKYMYIYIYIHTSDSQKTPSKLGTETTLHHSVTQNTGTLPQRLRRLRRLSRLV